MNSTLLTKASAKELRRAGKALTTQDTQNSLALGKHLYEVSYSTVISDDQEIPLSMFYGHPDVKYYAESELGISKRTVADLMRSWWIFGLVLADRVRTSRIEVLGRNRTMLLSKLILLQALQNHKLKKIEPDTDLKINLTDAQINFLVGSAEKLSVSELEILYKTRRVEYQEKMGLQADPSLALYTFDSRVTADELALIEKGISKAKKQGLGTRKGQALAGIVREWSVKNNYIKLKGAKAPRVQAKYGSATV